MTYSIHGCSAVLHHPSATATAGENCGIMNTTVSLKRKSLSPLSSPSDPSPKRVTLNSPPPPSSTTTITATIASTEGDGPASISPIPSPFPKSVTLNSPPPPSSTTTTAIATTEVDGPASISPITSPSPKRVSEKSPFFTTTAIAATEEEGGSASIPPITSPPPAFSPFSKRVSVKSPFSTTTTTADATAAALPLPFSRFTKTQPPNNNKNLRRTLSEPPIFESFSALCRYMKHSQSPGNTNNNPISVKSPLRRSISAPTDADILVPAAVKPPPSKRLKELLNEADDKQVATVPENNINEENNNNN